MLQRQRMFLKGGMPVGQRRMTCVTSFTGQTEVGQLKPPQPGGLNLQLGIVNPSRMAGMQRQQSKKRQVDGSKQ